MSTTVEPRPGGQLDTGGRHSRRRRSTRRLVAEWAVLIAIAVAIALIVKAFLFQAFYIPSESMLPALQVGDRVLVNKLSYDLHDVRRGDVVVFEAPAGAAGDGIKDLVKRVVGLPGETVEAREDGSVYIDGRLLREPYLPDGTRTDFNLTAEAMDLCGEPHDALHCVVPPGRVFVMGDNRTQSKDARVFGPIRESTIVGRVFLRIWPLGDFGFF